MSATRNSKLGTRNYLGSDRYFVGVRSFFRFLFMRLHGQIAQQDAEHVQAEHGDE